MLVRVEVGGNSLRKKDGEFEPTTFKALSLVESDVEEFIRNNIEVLFSAEDAQEPGGESVLIVGQQVRDVEGKRSDLTAVDGNGHLTLIEVKRDLDDSAARKEPLEFQAIRYAASLATIKTPEQLVELVYAPYAEQYKGEFADSGGLTSEELARRKLVDFLRENNALATFNQKQRIVLAASEFESQTLSAVAWLIANGVDISCFRLTPGKLVGEYFLDIEKLLPPPALESSYVTLRQTVKQSARQSSAGGVSRSTSGGSRTSLPKIPDLFEAGSLKSGDPLTIRDAQDSRAVAVNASQVDFGGERLSYNEWGQKVKGWSSIRIYDWAVHEASGKTLGKIRKEMMTDAAEEETPADDFTNDEAEAEEPGTATSE